MTNAANFEVEAHIRRMANISRSAASLLEQAEENGSLRDWNEAIKTSLQVQDVAGRELIRSRLRLYLMEAANVLSGGFDDQEDVELGAWADGCDEHTIHDRARQFIELHKGML